MATHFVSRVAPVNLHAPSSSNEMANGGEGSGSDGAGYFTFTVGKLDAGMAILIGDRASQIEFPSLLLPPECTTGSVVRIAVSRNVKAEELKQRQFLELQQNILDMFGRDGPSAPVLTLRAVTQTSITLEWQQLALATAKLLSLDIFRNNERLAAIPNPLNNTSTKLSGLEVDKPYSFHLVLRTTAGTFQSNVIKTKTHDMSDTSGISVCFGFMDGSTIDEEGDYVDGELEAQAKEHLKALGARWSDKIQIDTTHFVCTHPRTRASNAFSDGNPAGQMRGAMFSKAAQLSIPILSPHWIYACSEQKKLVPISQYYFDNKTPPNAAKVRDMIGRKSIPAADEAQVSPTSSVRALPQEEAAAASTSSAVHDEALPPTPLPKTPAVEQEDNMEDVLVQPEAHVSGEGREADAHHIADDIEGPATTSVAVPPSSGADEESAAVVAEAQDGAPVVPVATIDESESKAGEMKHDITNVVGAAPNADDSLAADGLLNAETPADERLDEISLGGESVKGDATEEIDLS